METNLLDAFLAGTTLTTAEICSCEIDVMTTSAAGNRNELELLDARLCVLTHDDYQPHYALVLKFNQDGDVCWQSIVYGWIERQSDYRRMATFNFRLYEPAAELRDFKWCPVCYEPPSVVSPPTAIAFHPAQPGGR